MEDLQGCEEQQPVSVTLCPGCADQFALLVHLKEQQDVSLFANFFTSALSERLK